MEQKLQKKGTGFWKGAIVGLIIGLIIGGAVYLRQTSTIDVLKEKIASHLDQIEQLEEQIPSPGTNGESLETNEKSPLDISQQAVEILSVMKEQNFKRLATYVHPTKGVRFSPYSLVNPEKDLLMTKEEIEKAADNQKVYTWGLYDGSGLPIELTIVDYFDKFVYDMDFLNDADKIGYNERIVQQSEMDNSAEIYPDASVVEYHYEGDEEYADLDWSSLRLVLEKYDGEWYLVGIIHAQWTI